jgi:hypothetical protein
MCVGPSYSESGRIIIAYGGATTHDQLVSALAQNPVYIQYKLTTSYQEKVITNQPLNTLDQNESQWVRSEWEKSLNILDIPNVPNTTIRGVTYNFSNGVITLNGTSTAGDIILTGDFNATLENGIYYYDSFGSTSAWLQLSDNRGHSIASGTVVVDREVTFRLVIPAGRTFNNYKFTPMLIKGSNSYPYQAYNANKHITNDEVGFIKEEREKGLNLLNIPDIAQATANGITYKVENGVFTLNGTATAYFEINLRLSSKLNVSNCVFTLFNSLNLSAGRIGLSIKKYQSGEVTDLMTIKSTTPSIASALKTLNNNNEDIIFIISFISGTKCNGTFKPMLIKGEKPLTRFYPYQGNIIHEKDLEDVNVKVDNLINGTTSAAKAVSDGAGNNIANTYATKTELANGVNEAKSYTESYTDSNYMPKSMTTTDFNDLWNRG